VHVDLLRYANVGVQFFRPSGRHTNAKNAAPRIPNERQLFVTELCEQQLYQGAGIVHKIVWRQVVPVCRTVTVRRAVLVTMDDQEVLLQLGMVVPPHAISDPHGPPLK
jgi:hypothetical protein